MSRSSIWRLFLFLIALLTQTATGLAQLNVSTGGFISVSDGGILSVRSAVTTVDGSLLLQGGSQILVSSSTVQLNGALRSTAAQLTFTQTSDLTVSATGEVYIEDSDASFVSSSLNNEGNFVQNDASSIYITSATLSNYGIFSVIGAANTIEAHGPFVANYGTMNLGSVSLAAYTDFLNATGATLNGQNSLTNIFADEADRGDVFIYGNYNASTSTFRISGNGSHDTYLQGSALNFYRLQLNRASVGALTVLNSSSGELTVEYMNIEAGVLDQRNQDVRIYSSVSSNLFNDIDRDFNSQKCILNPGLAGRNDATGGKIFIHWKDDDLIADGGEGINKFFPTATYSTSGQILCAPVEIQLSAASAVLGTSAWISVRPIGNEHPDVRATGVSLNRYWQLQKNDITISPSGISLLRFYYEDLDIRGNEDAYLIITRGGTPLSWRANPSVSYVIPTQNRGSVEQIPNNLFNGEWSLGEEPAVRSTFFSRQNGVFRDRNTWSRQGHNGASLALTDPIPGELGDVIIVGGAHTVTVTNGNIGANIVRIRPSSRLNLNEYIVTGDSLVVEDGAIIGIGHPEGIADSTNTGNVQTSIRGFSPLGIYAYTGAQNQITGAGLPTTVRSVIIENQSDTVFLSKSHLISDSLIINSGSLDVGTFTLNGSAVNRLFAMRGGEIIIRGNQFVENFAPPTFTAGRVTFEGTGFVVIPSNSPSSLIRVNQYYDLKIAGQRGSNVIGFAPQGEIRIGGQLTINNLFFSPTATNPLFSVSGSSFVFNGDGDQQIPRNSGNAGIATCVSCHQLSYSFLILRGSGNKTLIDDGHVVNNDLLIESTSAVFSLNGKTITVDGSVNNLGGQVNASGGTLILRQRVGSAVNTVFTNGAAFGNITVTGATLGIIRLLDDLTITENLTINNATLDINGNDIFIGGNLTSNAAGRIEALNSTVTFNNTTATQQLSHAGSGAFWNVAINKYSGGFVQVTNANIRIQNQLNLLSGNLRTRCSCLESSAEYKRFVRVDGSVIRTNGHVDGRLRLNVPAGAATVEWPLGNATAYLPVTMNIKGSGGTAGFVEMFSTDAYTQGINALVWETFFPNGAELRADRSLARHWQVSAYNEGTGTFQLGLLRTFDLTFNYVSSDVPGIANPLNFVATRRQGTSNTNRWFATEIGQRTTTSVRALDERHLPSNVNETQYYAIGEQQIVTFWSITSGTWSSTSTWSMASYKSSETATRLPTSNDIIRVGNGCTVVMDADHTVNTNRRVIVETGGLMPRPGTLDLNTRIMSGTGEFRLDSAGCIVIGDIDGITNAPSGIGNIRTATRNYNYNNHNYGHFVYAGSSSVQLTGNGLPLRIASFTVNKTTSTATVRLINPAAGTGSYSVTTPLANQFMVYDSLHIQQGQLDLSSNGSNTRSNWRDIFVAGNIRFGVGGRLVQRYGETGGDGSGNDNGLNLKNSAGIYLFGTKEQQIISPDTLLRVNRLILAKTGGVAISTVNIQAYQFIFNWVNIANIDVRTYNRYLRIGINILRPESNAPQTENINPLYGYVDGRLIRDIGRNAGTQWPIGSAGRFTPLMVRDNGGPDIPNNNELEVVVVDGNHPAFRSDQINTNTNIQKHFRIRSFSGTGTGGNVPVGANGLVLRTHFTASDVRGGINPRFAYSVFRLDTATNSWTSTANVSTIPNGTPENNNFNDYTASFVRTETRISAIFQPVGGVVTEIIYAIGESASSRVERIFYSRKSGNWNDPTTWSTSPSVLATVAEREERYNTTATASTYPQLNNSTTRDFVYIGAGHEVVMNVASATVAFCQVEKTPSGIGTLRFVGENYVQTNQFVLADGARLRISSANGIESNSTSVGNIRQAVAGNIINFNYFLQNDNHFEYIRNGSQNTGGGLPSGMQTLTIRSTGGTVTINNAPSTILIQDSLLLAAGTLNPATKTLNIGLDVINNSSSTAFGGASATQQTVLIGKREQRIRGLHATTFNALTINKDSLGVLIQQVDVATRGNFTMQSPTVVDLGNNRTLTVGNQGSIVAGSGGFSRSRMIRVTGSSSSGTVVKDFQAGGGPVSVVIPVGTDSVYTPAGISNFTGTFAANSRVSTQLRLNTHPQVLNPLTALGRWWNIATANITGAISANLSFTYVSRDVNGDSLEYLPGIYDPAGYWRVFPSPSGSAVTSPITVSGSDVITGSWTAGVPRTFAPSNGTRFYSRGSGNWSNPMNWTANASHTGNPATFPPGYLSDNDEFVIDANHSILFNIDSVTVRNAQIGNSTTGTGTLRFSNLALKKMRISSSLSVYADGSFLQPTGGGAKTDTLFVGRDILNAGTVTLWSTSGSTIWTTALKVNGSENTTFSGNGSWSVGRIILEKQSQTDTLINTAPNFSLSSTHPQQGFIISRGTYRHNIPTTIVMDYDYNVVPNNGVYDYNLPVDCSIDIRQGNIEFNNTLNVETATEIRLVTGATLRVGTLTTPSSPCNSPEIWNEHYRYQSGHKLLINGGTVNVAGAFTRALVNPSASVDFELLSGAMSVMVNGSSTQQQDPGAIVGFAVARAGARFRWLSGDITIANVNCTPNTPSYQASVALENVEVAGGVLKIGSPGNRLPNNDDITYLLQGDEEVGGLENTPLWSLDLVESRRQDNTFSPIRLNTATFDVLDSIRVGANTAFDLNGRELRLHGNLAVLGRISPNARGGLNSGGTLRFRGANNQTYTNYTTVQPAGDPNSRVDNETFFNVTMDKSAGKVILGTTASSHLTLRNTLRFFISNSSTAVIDARTNNRYVAVQSQLSGDLASIQREGQGFIDGRLRRDVDAGPQLVFWPVGVETSTSSSYTPVEIEFRGAGGSDNFLLDVTSFLGNHPNITSASIDLESNVQRWWSITNASSLAAVGARSVNIRTTFLPTDIRRSFVDALSFVHHVYRGSGWQTLIPGERTVTFTQSVDADQNSFGDFVCGLVAGRDYYSISNGAWNNPATWGDSYAATSNPWGTIPSLKTDRVFIGNGRTVTLTQLPDTVRAVAVEDIGSAPGTLNTGVFWISANSFTLASNCTLIVGNINGINDLPQNAGAIRASNLRQFGKAHYIFNANANQVTGNAIPLDILSLTISNTAPVGNRRVSLLKSFNVEQFVRIALGSLDLDTSRLGLYGSSYILREQNDPQALIGRRPPFYDEKSTNGELRFFGSGVQQVRLVGSSAFTIPNLTIDKSVPGATVSVVTNGGAFPPPAEVVVNRKLVFAASNQSSIVLRANANPSTPSGVLRLNWNSANPVLDATVDQLGKGYVNGFFVRRISTGSGTFLMPVGTSVEAPVSVITTGSGGRAGLVRARVFEPLGNSNADIYGPLGHRMDLSAAVPIYWSINALDSFQLGTSRGLRTRMRFPSSMLPSSARPESVIRRIGAGLDTVVATERGPGQIAIDSVSNVDSLTVENTVSSPWAARGTTGFGNFYIGKKLQRIFYSRSNGNWNNTNTWSFTSHSGAPAGYWPFDDPAELRDIVIISDGDSVALNARGTVQSLTLGQGTLTVLPNAHIGGQSAETVAGGYSAGTLAVGADSRIYFNNADGISGGTTSGSLRFTQAQSSFSPQASYFFSGNLSQQQLGAGFPLVMDSLGIYNSTGVVLLNRGSLLAPISPTTLILGPSSTFRFDNATSHSIAVEGRAILSEGSRWDISSQGSTTFIHTVALEGDLINRGTISWLPTPGSGSYVVTSFTGTSLQTISTGAGAPPSIPPTTVFGRVDLAKGNDTVSVSLPVVVAGPGPSALTWSGGGMWSQTAGALSFGSTTSSYTQSIPPGGTIVLSGSASLAAGLGPEGGSLIADGGSIVFNSTGASVIGSSGADGLLYDSESGQPGAVIVNAGSISVAGGFGPANPGGAVDFVQAGGSIVLSAGGGYSSATAATFELSADSEASITGGSIELAFPNQAVCPLRAPDIRVLTANFSMSGGQMLFGGMSTPLNSRYSYDVLPQNVFSTFAIRRSTLNPHDVDERLRIAQDILVVDAEATFDGRTTVCDIPTNTAESVISAGSNAANQLFGGAGRLYFNNLSMARVNTGQGVLVVSTSAGVYGVLNFDETGSTIVPQVISLRTTNQSMTVHSSATSAIVSSASDRYIQTIAPGTFLYRSIVGIPGTEYSYPLGTAGTLGADSYALATLEITSSSTTSSFGVRAASGSGAQGRHAQLGIPPYSPPTAWLNRYWGTTTASGSFEGRLSFVWSSTSVVGTESSLDGVGRWVGTEAGGERWKNDNKFGGPGSNINLAQRTFFAEPAASADLYGDWTLTSFDALFRTFYSYTNADWSNPAAWTFNSLYAGPAATDWPRFDDDRVFIANGITITADTTVPIFSITVGDADAPATTGTLLIPPGGAVTGLGFFTLGTGSTLNLQNADGIALSTTAGAILFDPAVRNFASGASYVFSGSGNQVFGDGFPLVSGSITVDKDNGTVLLNTGNTATPLTTGSLSLVQGVLNFDNAEARSVEVGSLSISSGATFSVSDLGTPNDHVLHLSGNMLNDGVLDFLNDSLRTATISFEGVTSQSVSGSGSTTFSGIDLAMGAPAAEVNVTAPVTAYAASGSVFGSFFGTWSQQASTLQITGGDPVVSTGGTLKAGGTGGISVANNLVLLDGALVVDTDGAVSIGDAPQESIVYGGAGSTSVSLTVASGSLSVAGGIIPQARDGNSLVFTQAGGTITLATQPFFSTESGIFDLITGSVMNVTAGTISLSNANSAPCPRYGDFNATTATLSVSGGTVRFGDASTVGSQLFTYDMPPGYGNSLHSVAVGATGATLRPNDADEELRLKGDLVVESGSYEGTKTCDGTTTTTASVIAENPTARPQVFGGNGALSFAILALNNTGQATVFLTTSATVLGTVDLRGDQAAGRQILALSSATLTILSSSANAVVDAGSSSFVATGGWSDGVALSGIFERAIAPGTVYVFPVGAINNGDDNTGAGAVDLYRPATFFGEAAGEGGLVAVSTQRGSDVDGSHLRLDKSPGKATDYLEHFWTVSTSATFSVAGRWGFEYSDDNQITGDEAEVVRIGRWRPAYEASGGPWSAMLGSVDNLANYILTDILAADEFFGDWTAGNMSAFRRIFYSRQSGLWNNSSVWSYVSHTGPIAGPTAYPDQEQDSVIVGGGLAGVDNHEVVLTTGTITVGSVQLGTGSTNTGTLNLADGIVAGNLFSMGDYSTLIIGSTTGIAQASTSGQVQTAARNFSTTGTYVYRFTGDGFPGDGLPSTVASLVVEISTSGTLWLDKDLAVTTSAIVSTGTLDVGERVVAATGAAVEVRSGAVLAIGGTHGFASSVLPAAFINPRADLVVVATSSTVRFYGSDQRVSDVPSAFAGYGNVIAENPGVKSIEAALLIRGDLSVRSSATLRVVDGSGSVKVNGVMRNDASVEVQGAVEVGN